MAIVQQAFYIPDDIATGILLGQYKRVGGVVRHAVGSKKGQIVKLLDPVEVKAAKEAKSVGAKMFNFANKNKKGLIIGGAITVLVTGGAIVYDKLAKRDPKVVVDFRSALRTYTDSIKNGSMSLETIEALMTALDNLRSHKDYKKISLRLTAEELDVLVTRIYEYTMKLAEDNHIDLRDSEMSKEDNAIIDLHKYLEVQKRIFKESA